MTTFKRGDLIVVEGPFTDLSGSKPRPVLVVSDEQFHGGVSDLLCCPVTSQPTFFRRPGPGDVPIHGWTSVGLRYPSTVRVSKMLAVNKRVVKRALGRVTSGTLEAVEQALRTALAL